MNKLLLILFSTLLLFSCIDRDEDVIIVDATTSAAIQENDISIISFNIRIFGRSKSSKEDVMSVIFDIIDDYDLIAIQEVRDITNLTLDNLINNMPENYNLVAGPREGRTSSKEQAIFLYDENKLDLIWTENYKDKNDIFERSPFSAQFQTDDKALSFNVVNVHLSPSDVDLELPALSNYVSQLYTLYTTEIITLGDFNADGSYFDEEKLIEYFPNKDYNIVIGNDLDTTVADSDNTYDRIIITDGLNKYLSEYGVLYFEDYLISNLNAGDVSDHYPVFIVLEY